MEESAACATEPHDARVGASVESVVQRCHHPPLGTVAPMSEDDVDPPDVSPAEVLEKPLRRPTRRQLHHHHRLRTGVQPPGVGQRFVAGQPSHSETQM